MSEKTTKINDETDRLFQGATASIVFKDVGRTETIHEIYGKSTQYFAGIITGILDKNKNHTFADFGGHKGELLQSVMDQLSDYNLQTVGIDIDAHLQENTIAQRKIPANLSNIPLESNSIDFGMMRYVLQWNALEDQKKILEEINRVTKDFVIVQHLGADNMGSVEWRSRLDELFIGEQVPKLKRSGCFFSSQNEVEEILAESGIHFRKLDSTRIENLSNAFIEKFALSENEGEVVRDILGDKDYIYQTTWLITKK